MAVIFKFQFTLFIAHFICLLVLHDAINLDARFSVVKQGAKDSYFGYSVAQHQIVDVDEDEIPKKPLKILQNTLLIGSPKQGNKGGALFRCNAVSAAEDCKEINGWQQSKPSPSEVTDDQWLGVSVVSQGTGGKAVACAHRYIKANGALGVCYVFTQALESWISFRPCEKVPFKHFMQDFGLCQAGMSAAIGEVKEDSLVMGAPGSVFWQGAIFLTNVSSEIGTSYSEIESPYYEPSQLSGNQQATPTRPYSYQGSAVTMGRFDSSKDLYYVSGAPKANSKGSIVFYKVFSRPERSLRYEKNQIIDGGIPFTGFGSSLMAVDINNDGFDDLIVGAPYHFSRNQGGAFYVFLGGKDMITNSATKRIEVLSRKMGDKECKELHCEHARFGMSLGKLGDINMDSYQDFAVGAPYEGNGAVYIYHGQADHPGFTQQYVQRIIASELPDQFSNIISFGHSLSGGIDQDGNGYPDLLVGAYESDTVVLIRSRPIIRIHPRMTVGPKLVNLDGTLQCTVPGVKDENKNRICVAVEICLNFTTKPANSIQLVPNVVYTLEAERTRRNARVELQDATDAEKKVVTGKMITLSQTQDVCATEIAFIKSKFEDKLNPIEFTFTFRLSTDDKEPNPYPTSATQDINTFPILDTKGAQIDGDNDVAVKVEFVKECGDDQKCLSNLQFTSELKDLKKDADDNYEFFIQEKNEIFVTITLTNEGEAAYLTRVYIQKPPLLSYLATINEEFSYVTCQDVPDDLTLIMCDQIGNPMRTSQGVAFQVQINVPREMAESTDLYNITAWVNTSSSEVTLLNDKKVMDFRVINRADIFLSGYVNPDTSILCEGEPRGASAIDDEEGIGASVKHHYIVRNFGPGVISESYITIFWPFEVAGSDGADGKYLLYLMRKPKITGPVTKCNDMEVKEYINPLGIREVAKPSKSTDGSDNPSISITYGEEENSTVKDGGSSSSSRRKRAVDSRRRSGRGGVVIMSCLDKSAKCFEYRCQIGKLEPGITVEITMEARLWESTLLSDYRKAADVQIISWGNLTLPKNSMIQQDTSNDRKRGVTSAIPDFRETSGQRIQWWIILVAVLVGIFVLLLVIFILYKLGFFRRKRPEDMQMYKAEKKQQAMLTDYDDREL